MEVMDLYKKTQSELYDFVLNFVQSYSDHFIIKTDETKKFILVTPKTNLYPVLVSHLDIYNEINKPDRIELVKEDNLNVYEGYLEDTRTLLGGDDRNGVWTMLTLMENNHNIGYLFTTDEECGCIGVHYVLDNGILSSIEENITYFLQIDRRGISDLAYYIMDNGLKTHQNLKFQSKLEMLEDYSLTKGSSTDIKHICKKLGICGINISAGYYNEHESQEYTDVNYLLNLPKTIEKIINLLGNERYLITENGDNYA